jgi:hypothetical protein
MSQAIAQPQPPAVGRQGPAQSKRDKYFALLDIGVLTQKQTKTAQKLATDIRKADAKQDKATAQKDAKREEARLLYEDRLARFDLALADLRKNSPATDKLVAKFDKARGEALGLLAQGGNQTPPTAKDYDAARKKLHEVSVSDAGEDGAKAVNSALKSAEKFAPEVFALRDTITGELAAKGLPLPERVCAAVRSAMFDFIQPLLAAEPTKEQADAAAADLRQLLQDLRADIAAARKEGTETALLYGRTVELTKTLVPDSADTPPLVDDRQAATMRQSLESARAYLDANEFGKAKDILDALNADAQQCETQNGPRRDEWLAIQPSVAGMINGARTMAGEAKSPVVQKQALDIARQLREVFDLEPGRGISFDDALARVKAAPATLASLRDVEAGWQKEHPLVEAEKTLADGTIVPEKRGESAQLAKAKKDVEEAFADVDAAFQTLHKAVKQATDGKHFQVADGPFKERLNSARAEWDERVKTAHDEDSLDDLGMWLQLAVLEADIISLASDPDRLEAAVTGGLGNRAKEAFDTAKREATEACEAYMAVDAAEGAAALETVEEITAAAESNSTSRAFRKATGQLTKLALDTLKKAQGQSGDVAEAQKALKEVLDPIEPQLAELRERAESRKTATDREPLVALLETFQSGLDGLRAMEKLTELNLLTGAKAEAEAFAKSVTDSLAAAKGKKGVEDTLTFRQMRKQIADLKAQLEKKTVALYGAVTQAALTEELKDLEKSLGKKTMTDTTAELAELEKKVAALRDKCKQAEQNSKAFEKTVVAGILKLLDGQDFKQAPTYVKAKKAEVAAILDDYRFEGAQEQAIQKASTLQVELNNAVASQKDERGVPGLVAAHEAAAQKQQNDKIVEGGKWDGECEVLEKRLKSLKSLNSDEISPLLDTLDSARAAVKKSQDFDTGREQLESIRRRLTLIEANPDGLAITARNKLPAVQRRVTNAITAFGKALEAVEKSVGQIPDTDLDGTGKAAVRKQLTALRPLFNPTVLKDPVAKVATKDQPKEARSGEREKALREVRRMQDYLDHDTRLRVFADTPFVPGVESVVSELALSLLDLENNLLVSL